jgi:hypothetical protein
MELHTAQIARAHLKALGYDDHEGSAEIGAFLASGEWWRLGLDLDQARELAGRITSSVASFTAHTCMWQMPMNGLVTCTRSIMDTRFRFFPKP